MNIPPKCEDLYLKIAELERREAALREELDRTKKAYEAYGIDFDRSEEKAAALQQRLTVAEQLLAAAHTYVKQIAGTGIGTARRLTTQIEAHFDGGQAALKPAAEVEIERYQGIPGTSFQRLNQLANEGE